jgi:hypothetical protein
MEISGVWKGWKKRFWGKGIAEMVLEMFGKREELAKGG